MPGRIGSIEQSPEPVPYRDSGRGLVGRRPSGDAVVDPFRKHRVLRMTLSMMKLFGQSEFKPIEYEGMIVHPMLRLRPSVGDRVAVQWLSIGSPRVQGLGVRLRHPDRRGRGSYAGLMGIGGVESPSIALWTDTAPPQVDIEILAVDDGAELRISNKWRQANGREDEWLNNYGILIDEIAPDQYLLHCSDGYGLAPTFDDQVVKVTLVRGDNERAEAR